MHADKGQSFHKFALSLLMEVSKSTQKYPKLEVGNIFALSLEKSVATAFVLYCDARHSDVLQGSSHVCCHFFSYHYSNVYSFFWGQGVLRAVVMGPRRWSPGISEDIGLAFV